MYRILILIARIVIFITMRFSVRSKNLVPADGPFLLLSNHLSVADPVLLGAKIGRRITFMAKEELFRNIFASYFVRSFGAIPVYRGSSNRDSLHSASMVLRQDHVLGMFPEGKRSLEGSLTQGQLGAALIAYHNKVRIVPVAITGTEKVRGRKWLFHRLRVVVTVGEPFVLPEIGRSLKKEQLCELTDIIMKKIAALLPVKYQGQYSSRNHNENNKS